MTGVGCWAPRSDESTELQWTVCNDVVASEWQLHPTDVRIIQSEEDNGLEALGEGAHWKVSMAALQIFLTSKMLQQGSLC